MPPVFHPIRVSSTHQIFPPPRVPRVPADRKALSARGATPAVVASQGRLGPWGCPGTKASRAGTGCLAGTGCRDPQDRPDPRALATATM